MIKITTNVCRTSFKSQISQGEFKNFLLWNRQSKRMRNHIIYKNTYCTLPSKYVVWKQTMNQIIHHHTLTPTKICSPKTDYETKLHFSCPSFHPNLKNMSCQSYNVKMLKSFQSYNKKQFEIYSHKKIAPHYYETNNHLPCHTFIPMWKNKSMICCSSPGAFPMLPSQHSCQNNHLNHKMYPWFSSHAPFPMLPSLRSRQNKSFET